MLEADVSDVRRWMLVDRRRQNDNAIFQCADVALHRRNAALDCDICPRQRLNRFLKFGKLGASALNVGLHFFQPLPNHIEGDLGQAANLMPMVLTLHDEG
jgi:hypothetical protein